jgi:structural maintenance of chromosome 2
LCSETPKRRPFSLQEGMFNNANVIFRTKFVDGVSTVTRTIGQGSSKKSSNEASDFNAGKGKSKTSRRTAKAGKENAFA